jgi:hypothetical protein
MDPTGTNARVTRREALRWIAAAPAAAAAAGVAAASGAEPAAPAAPPPPAELSDYARFVAKDEEGLSRSERARLRKQLPGLEGALKKLRDHPLADGVEPAFVFRARRPPRGARP